MAKRIYGLVGHPLGHSFSKQFFTEKFQRDGIDAEYRLWDLPQMNGVEVLPSCDGFNVTIPYKTRIIPFLDTLSEEARRIGAVNVVKLTHDSDGKIVRKGYNTDAAGLCKSLLSMKGFEEGDHRKALVLGTGGASKAVVYVLNRLGVEATLVSRNPQEGMLGYRDLNEEVVKEHTIIVNCTPLGTFPNTDEAPDIPYEFLTERHLCHDLVYNPIVTKFMRLSSEHGAEVKNGKEMLETQALAAWKIWNEEG